MKSTRTQITDMPERSVELSEKDMRIVAGGLRSQLACFNGIHVAQISVALYNATDVYTAPGDHDSD